MKLFLISNMYPSFNGDLFGVFVKNMKQELQDQGTKFSISVVIKGKSNTFLEKLKSYALHYLRILYFYFIKSSRYDIIYVHFITHHIPVLLLLLPFKKKPWVINNHGSDIIKLINNPSLNFISRIILKKVDLIVVPSSYFKIAVKNNYPFLKNHKIFVSPSGGIDPKRFYQLQEKKQNDILTLGFISRFIEEKGWKIFLEALKILKSKNLKFKAIIAGKGPDEKNILAFIEENQLQNEVSFLGFINQNELVILYNTFDAYIFPTYRKAESLGLTGVEALSCGTPVIASNIAGPSTYIEQEKNGYLFEPKNSISLAEKIIQFDKLNTIQKIQMQQNAIRTSKKFYKDTVAKKLIERLEKI